MIQIIENDTISYKEFMGAYHEAYDAARDKNICHEDLLQHIFLSTEQKQIMRKVFLSWTKDKSLCHIVEKYL